MLRLPEGGPPAAARAPPRDPPGQDGAASQRTQVLSANATARDLRQDPPAATIRYALTRPWRLPPYMIDLPNRRHLSAHSQLDTSRQHPGWRRVHLEQLIGKLVGWFVRVSVILVSPLSVTNQVLPQFAGDRLYRSAAALAGCNVQLRRVAYLSAAEDV